MIAPGSIVRREDIEALLRKPLEEAVRVPLRAFGTVGHRLRQRAQQVVEAAGALQIYRLFEVVGRRVVAFLQPDFRNLLLGRALYWKSVAQRTAILFRSK